MELSDETIERIADAVVRRFEADDSEPEETLGVVVIHVERDVNADPTRVAANFEQVLERLRTRRGVTPPDDSDLAG